MWQRGHASLLHIPLYGNILQNDKSCIIIARADANLQLLDGGGRLLHIGKPSLGDRQLHVDALRDRVIIPSCRLLRFVSIAILVNHQPWALAVYAKTDICLVGYHLHFKQEADSAVVL